MKKKIIYTILLSTVGENKPAGVSADQQMIRLLLKITKSIDSNNDRTSSGRSEFGQRYLKLKTTRKIFRRLKMTV